MAYNYDINFIKGDTIRWSQFFRNSDGSTFNFSGSTIYMNVRTSYSSGNTVINYTKYISANPTVSEPKGYTGGIAGYSGGSLYICIGSTYSVNMKTERTGTYEIKVKSPQNKDTVTILKGNIYPNQNVASHYDSLVEPEPNILPPLSPATSSVDYEVWAADWNADYTFPISWGTSGYTFYSIVPLVYVTGSENNGYRGATDTTGAYFDLQSAIDDAELIPESRRVIQPYYFWEDLPLVNQEKADYYKNTADGTTFQNQRFETPWCDKNYDDMKSAMLGTFKDLADNGIYAPYITDNRGRETVGRIFSLQGWHTYWYGGNSFDGSGNPNVPCFVPAGPPYTKRYPDARYFAAWISDSRFENYVNTQTSKTLSQRMVEFYNNLSGNTYSQTGTQLYSKAAGVTAFNDFTYYGAYNQHPYSYYGAGASVTEIQRRDEVYRAEAWMGAIDEFINGYYAYRCFEEMKAGITYFANTIHSSYEVFPVGVTEAVFFQDSNDQPLLKPIYPNLSGGNGYYGWSGNIIYPLSLFSTSFNSNLVSGYVLNPQTDSEKYCWQGYQNSSYTPTAGSTFARYAEDTTDLENWRLELTHKQFINDLKGLRHQFRSKPDFYNYHTPFVATKTNLYGYYNPKPAVPNSGGPYCLYNEFYDNGLYFREFMYHSLLHGVLYVMNYQADRIILQQILDDWRTISYNSKSIPCSNSTGDINQIVDRLELGDAITNVAMSGGQMVSTGKYLWRITAPPAAIRSDNTIHFQRVGTDKDIPETVISDGNNLSNGRGIWIERFISTPPNYVWVPE